MSSQVNPWWKEYEDPIMVLLLFFAWLAYVEVEVWRNTGHVVTHWTVLQGPALMAILFYLMKLAAVFIGKMIREDKEMENVDA